MRAVPTRVYEHSGLWSAWWGSPGTAGVFTDFDGTLSEIVADPSAARPLPGAKSVLADLSGRLARVAVISGRPVSYLEHHLGDVPRLHLIGFYGLETLCDGHLEVAAEARPWEPVVAGVVEEARKVAPPGVDLEPKGLSAVLHARRRPEHLDWALSWAAEVAERTGLVPRPGRMSVELLPPVGIDKGTVVGGLGTGLSAIAFVGDDTGDIPAFDALDRLRDDGAQTLAVAAVSAEVPTALSERADAVVDGPAGVLGLLEELASGFS